jgi:hypothetical protein
VNSAGSAVIEFKLRFVASMLTILQKAKAVDVTVVP